MEKPSFWLIAIINSRNCQRFDYCCTNNDEMLENYNRWNEVVGMHFRVMKVWINALDCWTSSSFTFHSSSLRIFWLNAEWILSPMKFTEKLICLPFKLQSTSLHWYNILIAKYTNELMHCKQKKTSRITLIIVSYFSFTFSLIATTK